MIQRTLTFLFILGINLSLFSQTTVNETISHDGGEREYIVHYPASYDGTEAVPLLLVFHGLGSSNDVIMGYSDFNEIADTANFIVVYPQGTVYLGFTHWNVGGFSAGSPTDDVDFVDALLDTLIDDFVIDETKIYSTGMSNGGFFSFRLACELSSRIAAVASVTGSMTSSNFDDCTPSHPTAVLQIHGNSDGTVPYGGDAGMESIEDVLGYWVDYNNCPETPYFEELPDVSTGDGTVEYYSYLSGDGCSRVDHYKVLGGDHTWPGAWGNMDIESSPIIWNFLSMHNIDGWTGCTTLGQVDLDLSETIQVYPNPSSGQFTLVSDQIGSEFDIINVLGQTVLSGTIQEGNQQLDLSDFPKEIYFLKIGTEYIRLVKK